MAIKKQMCVSHPERAAIGVCVITRQAICAECSTRYEGVNYSREGLRILQEQRAAREKRGARRPAWGALAAVGTPVLIALLYLFIYTFCLRLIDISQIGS